ncbi:sucrose nonfermenting 4-like protein isoform X1 [Cicer arietinum]|uniref:sucrose nonfermenting 4-like protein isoform X1 n=1 Tax=Cicer arietinum TaxID=3827 RepID=UPI003CC6C1C1
MCKGQFVGVLSALDFVLILREAEPYDNLKDAAVKILQKEVSTVPIIHSSSEDGSFPQLLHLASLSGILKCICRYFRHCSNSLPILKLPICAIPVGTWVPKIGESNRRPLAMLRPSSSLASALNLLVQAQVSSIPMVDDNDSLLDIYCRRLCSLARTPVVPTSLEVKDARCVCVLIHCIKSSSVWQIQVSGGLLLWKLAASV